MINLFRYIVLIASILGFEYSYAQKQNNKTTEVLYRISSPSKLSEIRFTKDTIYRENIEPANHSTTTITKYCIYKIFKSGRSRFFLVSPYYGTDREGYEVITLTMFPGNRFKIATTEQLGMGYGKYPSRKRIMNDYGNLHKLPFVSLYSKNEIESFYTFPHIADVSNHVIEDVLDSLIKIKQEYITIPDQEKALRRSVFYLYEEFISLALLKNKVSPFYGAGSFFQIIQKRNNNSVIIEKINKFFKLQETEKRYP